MCSGGGDGQLRPPGFPIRKPPDHSLAAGSPGLIAGSSVLHRLLVPRHPPCALKNLAQQKTLQDAEEPPTPPKRQSPKGKRELQVLDARVHCAVLKKRTAPQPPPRKERRPRPVLKTRAEARFLRTQQRARPASPVPRPEGNVLAGKRRKDPGE